MSITNEKQRNNPENVDVDMDDIHDENEIVESDKPTSSSPGQETETAVITQTQNEAPSNKEVSTPQNDQNPKSDNGSFLDEHAANVIKLQTIPNTSINRLQKNECIYHLLTYSIDKYISFVGHHYNATPLYILRRLVYKARDILIGISEEVILDDDAKLNDMALLDEESIDELSKIDIAEYLSTYARQYGIDVADTYYTQTSIEQKRIQLNKSATEYRTVYLKSEPIVTLNEHTTDKMIQYASLNMIKLLFENYVTTFEVDLQALSIDTMPHDTLIKECTKIRNTMRIEKGLPPLPSTQPHKGPSVFQMNVENRNGNLFSKFLSKLSNSIVRKKLANNESGQQAHKFEQNDFYVRVIAPVKGKDVHIPTVIKLVFGKLRQADPSFTLMTFNRNDTSKNNTIAKEDAIPKDKKDLHTWIQGDYISKHNKLFFSMRCTNNVPFKNVRALLNPWQKDTGIKVNFDGVVSTSLFPAGWLQCAHPRLLNRDSLFTWIVKQSDVDMTTILHLYPRIMFEYRKDGSKALTEVLVIDGAYNNKKTIQKFLSNIKWSGYYNDIVFIPFQANDDNEKQKQIESIDSHNEFCSKITSEVITIKRPDYVLSDVNGQKHTFIDWIATRKHNDVQIFYEVEQIGVTKILVAYFDHHNEMVQNFFETAYEEFLKEYFCEIAEQVFGTVNPATILGSAPRQSTDFFKRLKNLGANPQSTIDDSLPQRRVNAFYGQEPLSTTSDEAEVFGSKSYSAAAKTTKSDDKEIVRLSQIVSDLQAQVD